MVQPWNGIFFSGKKKWAFKSWKDGKILNLYCQSEKATYCVISTNWHTGKRQYYIGSKKKKNRWFPGDQEGWTDAA